MKIRNYLHCIGLILGVSGLVACQQAQHTFETEASVAAASSTPGVTNPPVPTQNEPEPLPDTRVACGTYLNTTAVIDKNASTDKIIEVGGADVTIDEPLRTVRVTTKGGGAIDIRSVVTAYLSAGSGKIRLNAQEIPSANVGSGTLCIRADHIGSVDASGASGAQVLIANRVDSISLGNAAIHIYNATVEHLTGSGGSSVGSYHQICLHKGATIKDYGPFSPSVANPDCDAGNPF